MFEENSQQPMEETIIIFNIEVLQYLFTVKPIWLIKETNWEKFLNEPKTSDQISTLEIKSYT